ncbi:hypothetical protein Tco_0764542, partial [Tanacetum coccineum]
FQDQKNSEDIVSIGSALEDFIFVVFVLVRKICSLIIKLELVPSCLIHDLEPLSLDIELLEIINLASSLDYLVILAFLLSCDFWSNMLILCVLLKSR